MFTGYLKIHNNDKPRLVLINVDCEQSTNWAVEARANNNILQNETESRRKSYHIISMSFVIVKNTSVKDSSSKWWLIRSQIILLKLQGPEVKTFGLIVCNM